MAPGALAAGETGAGTATLLELEEAVEIALQGSYLLGAADAGVGVAEARVAEAKAGGLPRVELQENVSYTDNPAQVFADLLRQGAFVAEYFDPAFLNGPDALSNFNTRVLVEQPIWTGGRLKHGQEAARLGQAAARAGRERTRQEVVRQVVRAYSDAILAESGLRVALESRETARANVKLVRDLSEAGLVVRSDLLQAEVRESEVEELVARSESAVAVAHAAVNLALGRDLGTPFRLPEEVRVDTILDEPLEGLLSEARERRPDLEAAGDQVAAAEAGVKAARAGHLPEIGVAGAWEANAEDFIGADGTNWSVFLSLRYTAFDGKATKARVMKARHEEMAARQMRTLLGEMVGLEVRQAYHDLRAARQRVEHAERGARLAEESLRMVQDRYREGLTTLVDLLDAETRMTRARTRELAARRDVLQTEAELRLAVGRL
jgi:outer membrane protein TolC